MNQPRNSFNSPLEIGQVPINQVGGGYVGITLCPGKWQANAAAGTWQRDMKTDLTSIARWGAVAVVTLMSQAELEQYRAGDLGSSCELLGMEWYSLPIKDSQVPDRTFENAWVYAGLRLRAHLRQGKNVLLHCRGGLGRSGTIAARLLVELGWSAHKAIEAVRCVRPGAIENQQQEKHVLSATAQPTDETYASRVLGCLLGGAVGDAFGYPIEFDRWTDIERKYGEQGLLQPKLDSRSQLIVSDDTQMTLFTLEALTLALPTQLYAPYGLTMERPLQAACQHSYLRWGHTQGASIPDLYEDGPFAQLYRSSAMRHRRAPGNTCLAAVRAGALGTVTHPINDSKGCGAVMRIAPIGLIDIAPEDAHALGSAAAALTHGHIDGWLPGGVLSYVMRQIMQGHEIASASTKALHNLEKLSASGDPAMKQSGTYRQIERALQLLNLPHTRAEAFAQLGEGWTGDEALAIGLYAACKANTFENAIRLAANHDGDSDSTASIAGQLYGAHKGITAVPHDWVARLDIFPDALELIYRFLNLENLCEFS